MIARYEQNIMRGLASLVGKILGRLVYFLQDGFTLLEHSWMSDKP